MAERKSLAVFLALLNLISILPLRTLSFSPDSPTDRKILVLLDDLSLKSSHSSFFATLKSRGFNLDFKLADDPSIAIKRYSQYLYDGIILFSPSADRFGGSLDVKGILDFVDSGHDLILAADSNASDLIRNIAAECGIDFEEYVDGTTDITRTVHFGKPSSHEKACYTAVLKGHIGLGNARFPNGTTGHVLDVLARLHLWKDGLDYRHGTGHGIGSFLNVHEGPHQISFRPSARNVALQSSMTVTDEPGYYEDGNFGIRLENVLVVKEADTKFNFGAKGYLSFEHITWAPYQTKLMDLSLLVPEEINWLNSYHSRCREILAPYLNTSEKEWLKKATEPVAA